MKITVEVDIPDDKNDCVEPDYGETGCRFCDAGNDKCLLFDVALDPDVESTLKCQKCLEACK